MKVNIFIFFYFLILGINLNGYMENKSENCQNNNRYTKILLELGAFPYLTEKGKPYYIHAKGCALRRDIKGWV